MIILDTNVVSELMKPAPDRAVAMWLSEVGDRFLVTTAVTVAEITFGLERLPAGRRKSGLLSRFEAFVGGEDGLAILPLEEEAAREAGRLWAMREAAGRPSQTSDMLIAGIAWVAGAGIATRNGKDFSHLTIEIIDPWRGGPG